MNAPYQQVAEGLASLGRYEDDFIVHAAEDILLAVAYKEI